MTSLSDLYQLQHEVRQSYFSAMAMASNYSQPSRALLRTLGAEWVASNLAAWQDKVAELSAELDSLQALIDSKEAIVCE